MGVPHTEVDLILVGGDSVDFGYRLKDGDRISVYPIFEALDITPAVRLRPHPLRVTRHCRPWSTPWHSRPSVVSVPRMDGKESVDARTGRQRR